MKNLYSLRLSVFAFFFFFLLSWTFVSAEELEFDWTWIGNEYDLFLKIDLNEGLSFDPLYTIHSNESSQTCEITCKPMSGKVFLSKDGHQLKNISIAVTVENTAYAKEVFYKVKAATSYFKPDESRKTYVVDYLYEDYLLNSTVDVTEEPLFYSFLEKEDSGVIRFLNLFRCQD